MTLVQTKSKIFGLLRNQGKGWRAEGICHMPAARLVGIRNVYNYIEQEDSTPSQMTILNVQGSATGKGARKTKSIMYTVILSAFSVKPKS